jgi:enamine deaminase RidA (YjgF/YER057c/UK114 family)
VNAPLCGTQIWAVSGLVPTPLVTDGAIAGVSWTCHGMRWCRLGGMRPPDRSASRTVQARALLEGMEQTLKKVGMDFGNVARTWFFFDDILAWYNDFNRTRDAFFRSRRVFDGVVPASTGIGGADPEKGALSAGLLALAPLEAGKTPRPLPSPLQCPAIDYGSSFSRAVEIDLPGQKRLFVSGTASIDPGGKTQHVGDTGAQVQRTLDVVEAILDSRGAGWRDVTRAIVYYKDGREIPAFADLAAKRGIAPLPAVFLHNDVCWDDLLFEIEVDAVVATADLRDEPGRKE